MTTGAQAYEEWHCWPAKKRRYWRERAAGPGWTQQEWNALVIKYEGKCLCCGSYERPLVPDHVEPLVDGGIHHISNIQPLCYICNIRKGQKVIDYRTN